MNGRLQNILVGAVLLLAMLHAGCRTANIHSPTSMVRTELFFGLSRPSGPNISDAEFAAFLDEIVTPLFPDGYTVVPAEGRWRGAGGTIREASRMLVILHPQGAEFDAKIEQIRASYKSRFKQEAVLRADEMQTVSF
jgi:Protein of unknown function (DUF3574)